jgi:hypothetical protein
MGLSSKKTKTKSQETTAPNPAYAPAINDAAGVQRQGYDESLAAQRQFQPGLFAASQLYGDTVAGKYLENPHVEGMLDVGDREITDDVTSAFNPGGRWGSAYWAKALGQGLADNRTRVRFASYDRERDRQNDAGRNLAGIATTATALPLLPGQGYADSIGGLLGRYMTSNGQSTSKTSGGALGGLLGSVLSGWASGGFRG